MVPVARTLGEGIISQVEEGQSRAAGTVSLGWLKLNGTVFSPILQLALMEDMGVRTVAFSAYTDQVEVLVCIHKGYQCYRVKVLHFPLFRDSWWAHV